MNDMRDLGNGFEREPLGVGVGDVLPEPDDREALAAFEAIVAMLGARPGLVEHVDTVRDALRRHPEPVNPSEAAVGRAAIDAFESIPYGNSLTSEQQSAVVGRAVLALLPGRSVAEVKAEALREFANHLTGIDGANDAVVWIEDDTAERRGAYTSVTGLLRAEARLVERGEL